ncbi:MAG: FKBP-type peptidyl-prolyl cis-trans isomerase [Planctomycetota bacterium]|nr:FKBP-type peptidyl-prolyl cis-trans isomerase [Planctomycetota bacterium]
MQAKTDQPPAAEDSGDGQATSMPPTEGDWAAGDTIPSGMDGVPDIQILKVHNNGTGDPCGMGKSATLKYKAMLANGTVIDPGRRPFTFKVGAGRAIKGWDVVVSKMRVGDSFTILLPMDLAYGRSKGDLKFDMELLSVK